jgi:membrane protease YdiL (CAAX protease family)
MSNVTSKKSEAITQGPQRTPWGPWRAVVGTLLSFYLAQEFAALVLSAYIHSQHWSNTQTDAWVQGVNAQFIYVVIIEALTIAIIYLFTRGYPQKAARHALGLIRPKWSDIIHMLLGFAAYYLLYFLVLTIANIFFPIDTNQKQEIGFDGASQSTVGLVLTFVSLVILPPIVEEIVFRGFLFRGLRRYWSPVIAALITSVLFALPHSMQSADGSTLWNAAIDTFALSMVLCYLREKTGALYAGIGVHALKNLVAFLALFIFHVQ